MCRELEAVDCGDVIFFPYAFMLRATAMNRIGHVQSDNERLEPAIMNDSPDNERLSHTKVTLSPKSDPLGEPKVIHSSENDTLEGSKVIHSPESDTLARSKVILSSKSDTLDTGESAIDIYGRFRSEYADFSNKEVNVKKLEQILGRTIFNLPTRIHIITLYNRIANNEIFGRKEIVAILGCSTPTGARIMNILKELDLITPIKGIGKGRYMFKNLSE